MSYRVINGKLYFAADLKAVCNGKNNTKNNVNDPKSKISFKDTLTSEINKDSGFTISNHAAERLKSRNINLNENDMKNINSAINKAENKGCSESALLYKNSIFITSIKNRTVITALDKNSNNDNIFTNIDSLVIV
ncbi:TIGR02530 family flagellar biosynthesis protein [Clostridium sp. 001]|uniref:TIGR02530 family flagellar biosynthesis protein n=1 Tax=Clostridium sp. 001 TaxID=1970093 RepID=UPI001C2C54BD|nr:TIGR02530 family flagellar biosynthesis protein [Clostridium sp. 001]QXE20279.1 flagellar biosynthesis protein [Clostridium sp. 001]